MRLSTEGQVPCLQILCLDHCLQSWLGSEPHSPFCSKQPPCSARPLQLQGGFEYKRAIVDCIISIIEENSESKETGLSHLCEFIEDCEFTVLATRILHLLGQEGPKTNNPSKYIRFIYNRVVLEHEEVRAGGSEPGLNLDSLACSSVDSPGKGAWASNEDRVLGVLASQAQFLRIL